MIQPSSFPDLSEYLAVAVSHKGLGSGIAHPDRLDAVQAILELCWRD